MQRNSSIDLGSGDMSLNCQCNRRRNSNQPLASSSINTGKGNDSIELNAIAEGENSRINQSSQLQLPTRANDWARAVAPTTSEYNYERSYGNWYSRYGNYS